MVMFYLNSILRLFLHKCLISHFTALLSNSTLRADVSHNHGKKGLS